MEHHDDADDDGDAEDDHRGHGERAVGQRLAVLACAAGVAALSAPQITTENSTHAPTPATSETQMTWPSAWKSMAATI